VASDIRVVPVVVSLRASRFSQGSVALETGGFLTAVEEIMSVLYLPTQNDACMSDDGLQVTGPDVVSSSPVDVALVSSNRPRVDLFSSLLQFHPPP